MARRQKRRASARRTTASLARRSQEVAQALETATKALTRLGCRFALVGGLAVTARSEPRFTADVDLAVGVDEDAEAERIVAALQASGWSLRMLIEQTAAHRLGTARFELPHLPPDLRVDLLFSASGIEREIVEEASPAVLPGGPKVVTASVGHLIAMKCLSESGTRLQDRIDLKGLIAIADRRDLATARAAIRAMTERGFARRKDVQRVLERAIRANR
jgi:hypothetical protein